jgi:hypothetical protein
VVETIRTKASQFFQAHHNIIQNVTHRYSAFQTLQSFSAVFQPNLQLATSAFVP